MKNKKSTHIYNDVTAPAEEQMICVTCGFCCDGTLFLKAYLNAGERGHLPEKMEEASFTEAGSDYFRQPCSYFSGYCTIYGEQRADVCSSYRCQLLKDFTEGSVSQADARGIIATARQMRSELLAEYSLISSRGDKFSFRQLLIVMGKPGELHPAGEGADTANEMFMARCNILEVLLLKNFVSAADFDRLMMKQDQGEQ